MKKKYSFLSLALFAFLAFISGCDSDNNGSQDNQPPGAEPPSGINGYNQNSSSAMFIQQSATQVIEEFCNDGDNVLGGGTTISNFSTSNSFINKLFSGPFTSPPPPGWTAAYFVNDPNIQGNTTVVVICAEEPVFTGYQVVSQQQSINLNENQEITVNVNCDENGIVLGGGTTFSELPDSVAGIALITSRPLSSLNNLSMDDSEGWTATWTNTDSGAVTFDAIVLAICANVPDTTIQSGQYTFNTNTKNVNTSNFAVPESLDIACPQGQRIIGGGAETGSTQNSQSVILLSSGPGMVGNNDGWVASWLSIDGSEQVDVALNVYAICANVG